jgi:hypothetical protein
MEEVEKADQEQLCRWYRFLPSPGRRALDSIREDFEEICNKETLILSRIIDRWREGGGFTPELSKKIGWEEKP